MNDKVNQLGEHAPDKPSGQGGKHLSLRRLPICRPERHCHPGDRGQHDQRPAEIGKHGEQNECDGNEHPSWPVKWPKEWRGGCRRKSAASADARTAQAVRARIQPRSKRSSSITLAQAATKSFTNFSFASALA